MAYHIIYRTTNITTGDTYLGKRTTEDITDGFLGSSTAIKLDIKKYGRGNFKQELLFINETKELNNSMYAVLLRDIGPTRYNPVHKSRGQTKATTPSRQIQAMKVSGENSASKRPEVRAKVSAAMTGTANHMYGRTGEASPNSLLSDEQRISIIRQYESGVSKEELHQQYTDVVKPATINKLILHREDILGKLDM